MKVREIIKTDQIDVLMVAIEHWIHLFTGKQQVIRVNKIEKEKVIFHSHSLTLKYSVC